MNSSGNRKDLLNGNALTKPTIDDETSDDETSIADFARVMGEIPKEISLSNDALTGDDEAFVVDPMHMFSKSTDEKSADEKSGVDSVRRRASAPITPPRSPKKGSPTKGSPTKGSPTKDQSPRQNEIIASNQTLHSSIGAPVVQQIVSTAPAFRLKAASSGTGTVLVSKNEKEYVLQDIVYTATAGREEVDGPQIVKALPFMHGGHQIVSRGLIGYGTEAERGKEMFGLEIYSYKRAPFLINDRSSRHCPRAKPGATQQEIDAMHEKHKKDLLEALAGTGSINLEKTEIRFYYDYYKQFNGTHEEKNEYALKMVSPSYEDALKEKHGEAAVLEYQDRVNAERIKKEKKVARKLTELAENENPEKEQARNEAVPPKEEAPKAEVKKICPEKVSCNPNCLYSRTGKVVLSATVVAGLAVLGYAAFS